MARCTVWFMSGLVLVLLAVGTTGVVRADDAPVPTVAELVAAFRAQDGAPLAERLAALRAFARVRTGESAGFLARTHGEDGEPNVRLEALRLLGQVGADPAREVLIRVSREGAPNERPVALQALGAIRPPVPPGTFLDALGDRSQPALQPVAARCLAAYPQLDVAAALVVALDDPDRALRRAAGDALRALIGRPPLDGWFVAALGDERLRAARAELVRLAPACEAAELIPALHPLLRDPHPDVRAGAADALGQRRAGQGARAQDTQDALTVALRDRVERVALSAIVALGRIGPSGEALDVVLDLCRQRNPGLRAAAVGTLEGSLDPRALKAACKALEDKAPPVRAAAIAALGTMRETAAVDALVEALRRERAGRLEAELLQALRGLTGANPGDDAKAWKRWWGLVRGDYDLKQARTAAPARAAEGSRTRGVPTYYGSEVVSRRVAFVIDVSGSMSALVEGRTRLQLCQDELRAVIGALPARARFNVIAFDHGVDPWQEGIVPAGSAQKAHALEFVGALAPRGGTNIFDPLERALLDPEVDTIYLLSDGAPGAGRFVRPDEILREVAKLNAARQVAIHTISVGMQSPLMAALAAQNGGKAVVR